MSVAFKSTRRPSRRNISATQAEETLVKDVAEKEAEPVLVSLPGKESVQEASSPEEHPSTDVPAADKTAPEAVETAPEAEAKTDADAPKPPKRKASYSTKYTADINVPIKMLRNPNAAQTSDYRVDVKIGDGYGQLLVPHSMYASTSKNGRSVHFHLPLSGSFSVMMKKGPSGGSRAGESFTLTGTQVRDAFVQFFGAYRAASKSADYGTRAEDSLSVNQSTEKPSGKTGSEPERM